MEITNRDPVVITAATDQAVGLDEFRSFARLTGKRERGDQAMTLELAETMIADYLGRTLLTTTLELRLDAFPGWAIALPRPPLASVSSVKYDNADGEQTVSSSDYESSNTRGVGVIRPVEGASWPSPKIGLDVVRIQYVAGWTKRAEIPTPIRAAIMRQAIYLLENRGDVADAVPASIGAICGAYRIHE